MNTFLDNNHKNRRQIELKTPLKTSHNRHSGDERIIALVRFLARCAAEEDYRMFEKAPRSSNK